MSGEVRSILYSEATDELRRQFALLQHRVDPDWPMPEGTVPAQHDPALNVRSFYSSVDSEIVSYAAVVRKTMMHCRQEFNIAGLSYVATDPDHQHRGLGSQTVRAATAWIERSGVDFGVFTCDPPLVSFYEQAGGWAIVPDAVLIGSHDAGALRSDVLRKVVLMRLFSAKARGAALVLKRSTINLDLPVGQFL
ncbi:GNAT family N-acetyltransferase [Bradyrhizobium brasilense]|uniref:GNAT family N-acetyltransferase n=1 Tax=Bradyrhizobium brasilense TaxID=1419277 RepID=UPI0009754DAD|nr:GNAT family N-acetyltransferase [Bradyrhizobium brasilense]OMI00045.1 GNAT family N-acetyltransferase [Bradyrhizobium brasilense]